MPELPDVETFRRYFDRHALNQEIREVAVKAPRILDGIVPEDLNRALKGRRFLSSSRHGKVLFARTDGQSWLSVHFGMSGFFHYFQDPADEPSHDRCLISFENGSHLAYDNRRMIGRIGLVGSPQEYIERHNLGPDALTVDEETFRSRLSGKSGKIKQILMDQELLAGIGNEYADEILFQTRLHPETKGGAIDAGGWHRLYQATAQVLDRAVASEADAAKMPKSFLLSQRGRKGSCPRCGTALGQLKVGGRTSYFCAGCQPVPS